MSALRTKTHHVLRITITDHTGTHDGREVRVHVSRECGNCDHFRPNSSEDWNADADGPCMDQSYPAGPGMLCDSHQTAAEFAANIHRPDVPVFRFIQGGAAA